MYELLWAMLFLGIAACSNWLLGLYDKIGVQRVQWDWKEFLRGLAKIAIICGVAIGLGFAWEYSGIDLTSAGLSPITCITAAFIYYAVKSIKRFAEIIHGSGGDPTDPVIWTEDDILQDGPDENTNVD